MTALRPIAQRLYVYLSRYQPENAELRLVQTDYLKALKHGSLSIGCLYSAYRFGCLLEAKRSTVR